MATFKRVTPPAEEPVALEDARAFLRVAGTEEDGLIARLLTAARERVEAETGGALVDQTWRMAAEVEEGRSVGAFRRFRLARAPYLAFVEARLARDDGTSAAFELDDVRVDPDGNAVALRLDGAVLSGRRLWRPVEIVWRAGYGAAGDVPDALRTAILMLTAEAYERAGDGGVPVMATAPGIARLLSPFREARL